MSTAACADTPASVCREVIDGWIAHLGFKVGLFRAAQALGVTERWARGLRAGEPARVDAAVYLRAVEARRLLRAERRARLLAELQALETADDQMPAHHLLAPRNRAGRAADDAGRVAGGPVCGATEARDAAVTR